MEQLKVCPRCGYKPEAVLADLLNLNGHSHTIMATLERCGFASYSHLIDRCYPYDIDGGPDYAEGVVKVLVHHIRKKLKNSGEPYKIATVYGEGYRLEKIKGASND